jgi:hypothetical protein
MTSVFGSIHPSLLTLTSSILQFAPKLGFVPLPRSDFASAEGKLARWEASHPAARHNNIFIMCHTHIYRGSFVSFHLFSTVVRSCTQPIHRHPSETLEALSWLDALPSLRGDALSPVSVELAPSVRRDCSSTGSFRNKLLFKLGYLIYNSYKISEERSREATLTV